MISSQKKLISIETFTTYGKILIPRKTSLPPPIWKKIQYFENLQPPSPKKIFKLPHVKKNSISHAKISLSLKNLNFLQKKLNLPEKKFILERLHTHIGTVKNGNNCLIFVCVIFIPISLTFENQKKWTGRRGGGGGVWLNSPHSL